MGTYFYYNRNPAEAKQEILAHRPPSPTAVLFPAQKATKNTAPHALGGSRFVFQARTGGNTGVTQGGRRTPHPP
jgi:hypothetical protein